MTNDPETEIQTGYPFSKKRFGNAGRVAIVVIGRNEGKNLARSINSLNKNAPIIYVDSASTDDSVDVAASLGAEVVALPNDPPTTAARGRNAGAKRCFELCPNIEYIQFIDGDCELTSGWISRAEAFLDENPDIAVVCGRRAEKYPERSIYNLLADKEWDTPVGEADSCGGDSLVRASAFQQVGGFNSCQMAHEEPEFCARLRIRGWRIWRLDVPMTMHDMHMTSVSQYYRRSRRAGYGISQVVFQKQIRSDAAAKSMFARAVFWGACVPFAILISAMIDWRIATGLFLIVLAQFLRMLLRGFFQFELDLWTGLKAAALSFVSKYAELHGIVDFLRSSLPKPKSQ